MTYFFLWSSRLLTMVLDLWGWGQASLSTTPHSRESPLLPNPFLTPPLEERLGWWARFLSTVGSATVHCEVAPMHVGHVHALLSHDAKQETEPVPTCEGWEMPHYSLFCSTHWGFGILPFLHFRSQLVVRCRIRVKWILLHSWAHACASTQKALHWGVLETGQVNDVLQPVYMSPLWKALREGRVAVWGRRWALLCSLNK